MIEFQKAPEKEEANLSEMIELRRKVEAARASLSEDVKNAKLWKAVKKADTLIFSVSTLVLGGAFAGLLAGSTALAEAHHVWSVVLTSASFIPLLPGVVTLSLTFTNAIGISVANIDLDKTKAKLATFDATPVDELELEEVPTE